MEGLILFSGGFEVSSSPTNPLEKLPILCFDTSTTKGVLVLGAGGNVLAERVLATSKGHAGWLMPAVEELLDEVGLGKEDLGAIACGIGPGNYTGVKVGVSTAKALAYALELPLIGLNSLDILAWKAVGLADMALVTRDAKQGLFFASLYRIRDFPERITEYLCAPVSSVLNMLAGANGRIAVLCEDARRIGTVFHSKELLIIEGVYHPDAKNLYECAMASIKDGAISNAVSVLPVYLKKPV